MESSSLSSYIERIEHLQGRIATWRGSSHKSRSMPEDLWCEASALAEEYGIYKVSKALNLNYRSLKERVEAEPPVSLPEPSSDDSAAFIELPGTSLFCKPSPLVTVLELDRADGSRLTIRLGTREDFDAAAVVSSFMGAV